MKHPTKQIDLTRGTFRTIGPCDGCPPADPAYDSAPEAIMWWLVIGNHYVVLCPECAMAVREAWNEFPKQMEAWRP